MGGGQGSTGMAIWAPYRYRVLLGYGCCMGTAACVPQAHPIFSKKKMRYGSGTDRAQVGYERRRKQPKLHRFSRKN